MKYKLFIVLPLLLCGCDQTFINDKLILKLPFLNEVNSYYNDLRVENNNNITLPLKFNDKITYSDIDKIIAIDINEQSFDLKINNFELIHEESESYSYIFNLYSEKNFTDINKINITLSNNIEYVLPVSIRNTNIKNKNPNDYYSFLLNDFSFEKDVYGYSYTLEYVLNLNKNIKLTSLNTVAMDNSPLSEIDYDIYDSSKGENLKSNAIVSLNAGRYIFTCHLKENPYVYFFNELLIFDVLDYDSNLSSIYTSSDNNSILKELFISYEF